MTDFVLRVVIRINEACLKHKTARANPKLMNSSRNKITVPTEKLYIQDMHINNNASKIGSRKYNTAKKATQLHPISSLFHDRRHIEVVGCNSLQSRQTVARNRNVMCPSTNDTEGKVKTENTPLHLTPSLSESNLRKLNKSGEGSSRSGFSSPSEKSGDESKSEQFFVSLSVTQSRLSAKAKSILSLMEDNEKNDDPNSSFLADSVNAFSEVLSENGSIAEGKDARDNDSQVGAKNTNFCAEMMMQPGGFCQGTTDFAEQMDIFMRCQHPLDILSIFQEDGKGATGVDAVNNSIDVDGGAQPVRASGYHAIARKCEYCGSQNIDLCREDPDCERPKTYFPRERPPFCSKGGSKWATPTNIGTASKGEENDTISTYEEFAKHKECSKQDVEATEATMACSAWV